MDPQAPSLPSASTPPAEQRVEIHAHCALTKCSANGVVGAVALGTLAVATPFVIAGFWPVLVFALIEIAGVHWAVRTAMRAGREHETIIVTEHSITVAHSDVTGERRAVFPRHWSRVTLRAPLAALHPSRLLIESHGRACEVGRFLTEDERRTLAARLTRLVGNMNESPAL